MALTALQRRKLAAAFRVLDADRDGVLGPVDRAHLVEALRGSLGLEVGSAPHEELEARVTMLWACVAPPAVDPLDRGLSLDGVRDAAEALLGRDDFRAQIDAALEFLWFVLDADHDGRAPVDDCTKVLVALGLPAMHAGELLRRLGRSPLGPLTRVDFVRLVGEFLWGDDPEEPGAWLCGPP